MRDEGGMRRWVVMCNVETCKRKAIDSTLRTCKHHADTCPICIDKLGTDDTSTLRCGHMYHACCIYKWFDRNVNCPLCRA